MATTKKGELLNQMAIISDLLENINLTAYSKTIVFDLSKDEFEKIFKIITNKIKTNIKITGDRFSVKIGEIDFMFVSAVS
jgi:hypothetical protein